MTEATAELEAERDTAAENGSAVSVFWGDERKELRAHNWLEHPVAKRFINKRVSGDPAISTIEYWRNRYLPEPVPLALSLGCGFGSFERHALQVGLAHQFEACDVSLGAIEQAGRYAAEAGLGDRISYSVKDLNHESLPPARFSAIFAISSIHHIFELEKVFRRCREGLTQDGLLFLDEYIGPSRFQCTPKAVETINRLLTNLPARFRHNVFLKGQPIEKYTNPSITWFEENDPSEAVRSAEILSTLKYYFDIIDYRPYGGGLLHMLLSGIAGNFDPASDADTALLQTIAIFEETLEEAGVIQSDFAAIVARPRLT